MIRHDMLFYWDIGNFIYCNNGNAKTVKVKYSTYYVEYIEIENNIYEVKFDMYKKTFSIKDKNGKNHIIVTDFKGALTPYISLGKGYCKLLKAWIE